MLSSKNVLDSAELKKLKINRKDNLLNRAINYINHCGTHKCSKYCHLVALRNVIYNNKKHKDVKEDDIFSKDGDIFARIKVIECRMKFGKQRFFDKSGENNLTRGIAIRLCGSIICAINGQPRFHANLNHSRILQQPYFFYIMEVRMTLSDYFLIELVMSLVWRKKSMMKTSLYN